MEDYTDKKIEEIYKKTRMKLYKILLAYLPAVLIRLFMNGTNDSIFMLNLLLFFHILPFIVFFKMLKKELKGNIAINELRTRKMYMDGNYESKLKILASYNAKYKYKKNPVLKYYFILVIFVPIIFLTSCSDINGLEKIIYLLLSLLFSIIILVIFTPSPISSNKKSKNFSKLIEKFFNPKIIKTKSIEPIFDSDLYSIPPGIMIDIKEHKQYFHYRSEDFQCYIYNEYPIYNIENCNIHIYNILTSRKKNINGHVIKVHETDRSILFVFKTKCYNMQIKITNNELNSKESEKLENLYTVHFINYFLSEDTKKILDMIYKYDVVDICSNNGNIYIKKYIPDTISESDIKTYLYNFELYKKLIQTLK